MTAAAHDQSVIKGGVKIVLGCQRIFQSHFIMKFMICCHIVSSNVFVVLYNKSLNDCSLGKHITLFPSNLNVSLRGLRFLGTKLTVSQGTSH